MSIAAELTMMAEAVNAGFLVSIIAPPLALLCPMYSLVASQIELLKSTIGPVWEGAHESISYLVRNSDSLDAMNARLLA